MRTSIKYILTIPSISIFILASFFLPEVVTNYTDQNILGKVRVESVELPKIISGNNTSIIEKINLLRDYPQNVNQVALKMGTNFDLTSASDKFFEEISVLTKLGLLPKIEPGDKTTIKIDVSLYAQKDDPSISGVLWNIVLQGDKVSGNFYMDDQTGKLIQFIASVPAKPSEPNNKTIEKWAEYLGLEVQDIKLQAESNSVWEDETTKVANSEGGYYVYHFELEFEGRVLPYAFYSFKNGYGFGYIMNFISGYNDTFVKIRP
ncbi:hypothetical protein [Paenibacillus donghaensis]|uniref:Uncharacterized protein n=1 Tax=Paenibacillus donghaensis TaxID=414771 RepID=A0A2Z2K4G0_9BACL|nr:hypothetical protein [Paenibacillus donghaensis]ASA20696.1 hypothetical protein B9T62_07775 [Paenibacillus donghaensis]